MDEPIEEYFTWLYTKVASVEVPTPSLTYYTLLRDLHAYEFVWTVQGDDNRAEDGVALRREFNKQIYLDEEQPWFYIGCSVLEMLIAFARHAEFQTDISARDWFWIFMENLQLSHLNDAQPNIGHRVGTVLERFVWRTYSPSGQGGLFPLRDRRGDQRKIELWYQFCEYMIEQES